MSAIAFHSGDFEMAGGFTDEDRRRFERIDIRLEDILKRFDEVVQRVRDVEVDLDELRMSKAERSDLSESAVQDHETRMRLVEKSQADIAAVLAEIKRDLEPLKAWRWKELGAVGAIVALAEFAFHVLVK
jgi:hypothetical protein